MMWRLFAIKYTVMAAHNDLGRKGEDMAVEYLQQNGYCILNRNWTNKGHKEIDIIATKDDIVVFVEVKTRRQGSVTSPVSAVDGRKQHRISLAADSYLKSFRIDFPSRFDIICIVYNDKASRVEHIEDAFRPRPRYY